MYQNILIATDGSEIATRGLSHGLNLAKALKLPVTIITTTHIWPPTAFTDDAGLFITDSFQNFEKFASKEAKIILKSAQETADELDVSCECIHVGNQYPAEGILETATSKGCDLIVMSSHGRRGFKKVLLGSVANEVLANSKVPVLIVR
jgi:nucleotide-binding universal stress UspA family protein